MTGRVIRFKSLVRLIGITGWKFQLLFQWPLFSRKLLNWLSMDQTLLTGLLSFRFRSLADSASPAVWWAISSSWASLTAPKLKFSTTCKGTRSETGASCEKGSPTELMLASTPEESWPAHRLPTEERKADKNRKYKLLRVRSVMICSFSILFVMRGQSLLSKGKITFQ